MKWNWYILWFSQFRSCESLKIGLMINRMMIWWNSAQVLRYEQIYNVQTLCIPLFTSSIVFLHFIILVLVTILIQVIVESNLPESKCFMCLIEKKLFQFMIGIEHKTLVYLQYVEVLCFSCQHCNLYKTRYIYFFFYKIRPIIK